MSLIVSDFIAKLNSALKSTHMVKAFSGCHCEKCFQKSLRDLLGASLTSPRVLNESVGFFGYKPKRSDLVYNAADGRRLLVECKLLTASNGCEVRNAFLQLLEYMYLGQYSEGIVLVYDIRVSQDSLKGELNQWLVERMSSFNIGGANYALSLVHIFKRNGAFETEVLPS